MYNFHFTGKVTCNHAHYYNYNHSESWTLRPHKFYVKGRERGWRVMIGLNWLSDEYVCDIYIGFFLFTIAHSYLTQTLVLILPYSGKLLREKT